jgi:hypothetical protein
LASSLELARVREYLHCEQRRKKKPKLTQIQLAALALQHCNVTALCTAHSDSAADHDQLAAKQRRHTTHANTLYTTHNQNASILASWRSKNHQFAVDLEYVFLSLPLLVRSEFGHQELYNNDVLM